LSQQGVDDIYYDGEKFRNGEYGIGGDLKEVVDGSGEVKVVAVPKATKSQTGEMK
jgi:hypothetical protein